ncbi:hypothetical protein [Nostoc sp.]
MLLKSAIFNQIFGDRQHRTGKRSHLLNLVTSIFLPKYRDWGEVKNLNH